MCGSPSHSGKNKTTTTNTTATTPTMPKAYFQAFLDFFLGLFASERFLRHLPDFVRSRSFDHLPSSTRGTGMLRSPCSSLSEHPAYMLNRFRIHAAIHPKRNRCGAKMRKLKLTKPLWLRCLQAFEHGDNKNRQPESVEFGKSQNRTNQTISARAHRAVSREILQEFRGKQTSSRRPHKRHNATHPQSNRRIHNEPMRT
jgi:hypothetical protein